MTDSLSCFFAPSSIAVVGASDDPAKWGHIIARQSVRNPEHEVWFVNSRAATVLGRPTVPSVTAIGRPVDLAVVSVPVAAFESVVDDVIASGVRAVLAITAGFAELGEEGIALQQRCTERLRAHGVRMIGPNCLGLSDNHSGTYLAANDFAVGEVALLSQSGNLALELDVLFREAGLGFSRFISMGNQADVTLVELMDSCVADPSTSMLALYVEDFIDGRAFIAAAQRAASAGKPVVVLASGSSPAALRSAGSHTGALSSDEAIVRMACASGGALTVRTPRELVNALLALRHAPAERVVTVGVVTDGGGHGTLAAGLLEAAGFEVPSPSDGSQEALRACLWGPSSVANPVDLAGYGEQDPASYAQCVDLLLAEMDAVLVTGYFGGYSSPTPFAGGLHRGEVEAATAMVRAASRAGKPVVVHSVAVGSEALGVCAHGGIPVFRAIEDAVSALGRTRASAIVELEPVPAAALAQPSPTYAHLRTLLRDEGLPSGAVLVASDAAMLEQASLAIAAPWVLKTAGSTHKSDAGGVRLAIPDLTALLRAYEDMVQRTHCPEVTLEAMQPVAGAVELIVGVRQDPRFGPVLAVGAGGVLAELLQDVVLACAPVTASQALALLRRLRLWPLLCGFRGAPALDAAAAADAIARLSLLAARHPEWREFEVNPMAVTQEGAHILDARALP